MKMRDGFQPHQMTMSLLSTLASALPAKFYMLGVITLLCVYVAVLHSSLFTDMAQCCTFAKASKTTNDKAGGSKRRLLNVGVSSRGQKCVSLVLQGTKQTPPATLPANKQGSLTVININSNVNQTMASPAGAAPPAVQTPPPVKTEVALEPFSLPDRAKENHLSKQKRKILVHLTLLLPLNYMTIIPSVQSNLKQCEL
jgi:hypothetical protein